MFTPALSIAVGLLNLAFGKPVGTCQSQHCSELNSDDVGFLQETLSSVAKLQLESASQNAPTLIGALRQVFGTTHARIPNQLLLTAKPATLDEMGDDVIGNVLNTIQVSSSSASLGASADEAQETVHPRWFGDKACHAYIAEHYDKELVEMFENAHPGYYRGDICRAAVLYQEGGFYTDVDVQLAVPLANLVDENTTFMSAYSVNGDIFNGLLAVVPKSTIMAEALEEIRRWYRKESEQVGLMGTMTMLRALENVVAVECPTKDLEAMKKEMQWTCGQQALRLYQEAPLICNAEDGTPQQAECPEERKQQDSEGLRYGLFQDLQNRRLIGWPRFHNCRGRPELNGCGSGGHSD